MKLAALLTTTAAIAAFATTARDAHALVDAVPSTSSEASFNLLLCEGKTANTCQPICGGTLIGPNLVATSRHCGDVVPIDALDCRTYRFDGALKDPTTMWVTAASSIATNQPPAAFHRGIRWDVPLSRTCGHDLALLTLETPMDLTSAPPRVPAFREDAVSDVSGEPLMVYGFGRTNPHAIADGTRRQKEARVLCIGGHDACTSIPGGRELLPTEFAIDAVVCPGDSGSGVFDARGGSLLGTLGRSIGGEKICGNGVYIRLTPHTLLLARAARAASIRGEYTLPSWVDEAERLGNSTAMAARAFGAPCDGAEDCKSGECSSYDGGLAWSCAETCSNKCQGSCRSTPMGDRCFFTFPPPPETQGCSCAAAAHDDANGGAIVMVLAAAMIVTRRRTSS